MAAAAAACAIGVVTAGPVGSAAASTPSDFYSAGTRKAATVSNGRVDAMVTVGNRVILGGSFTSVKDVDGTTLSRPYLVAVNASTGAVDRSWRPSPNKRVRSLTVDSAGRVYVAGDFTSFGGSNRSRIARLTNGLAVDSSWWANTDGVVYDVAVDDSRGLVFLGGAFSVVRGASANRLAAVSLGSGAPSSTWKASANSTVRAVATVPGTSQVVVGGDFSAVNSTSRKWVALLDGSGSLAGVQPDPNSSTCSSRRCPVLDLAAGGGRIFAAMGGAGNRVVAWQTGSSRPLWTSYGDGDAQALGLRGTTVWVGGHFNPSFGKVGSTNTFRSQLAGLDVTNGETRPYGPLVEGRLGVFAIDVSGSWLRIAGEFARVDKNYSINRYAAFPATSSTDATAPGTPGGLSLVSLTRNASTGKYSAKVQWNAAPGSPKNYRLIRALATGGETWYTVRSGTQATDGGLRPSRTYVLRVVAVDAANNVSFASDPITVRTP